MSNQGIKRASPGASEQKHSLTEAELTDDDAAKLQEVQRDIARTELILERRAQEKLLPAYAKRREIIKPIANFWNVALMNHSMFAMHAQHHADQVALTYLEDVWLERDPKETRCFTLEFHFKENPYFSNKVLKKEYRYVPPPAAETDQADDEGITESMLDFSWERDVIPQAFKIDWKDESKNLTKLHPRVLDDDLYEEMPLEGGSFFNFFETATDPFDLGVLIANDVFPEVIDYFLGRVGHDDIDSDEDDESDDGDEDEIDLEKPRSKKQKQA